MMGFSAFREITQLLSGHGTDSVSGKQTSAEAETGGKPIAERKIVHLDCDCFFAAIEMRDDPSLRGRPMAVGGGADRRGVISTCNYEARQYGVHSAMATATALRLCPGLIVVPHRMEAYKTAATEIREIFSDYSSLIEPLSLDEAFLDVSDSTACQGSATLIAEDIRRRVVERCRITISAGVAPNKFLVLHPVNTASNSG